MQVNRRGLRDWLVQRISAVLIGIYAVYLVLYIAIEQPLSFSDWHQFFHNIAMRIATFIVLLGILWHAWIGIWTVFTDYVKPKAVRLVLETIVCLALLAYLGWMIEVLWVRL